MNLFDWIDSLSTLAFAGLVLFVLASLYGTLLLWAVLRMAGRR